MTPTRQGSFRLFRFAGIQVYLHWSWFLVAAIELQYRRSYDSPVWNVLEYLSLFGIVLLHEFGHSLACRSVGGKADQIVLWPLGGVAYVSPPQRPGANLWSIAAGPLVNVLLLPIFGALVWAAYALNWAAAFPDLTHFLTVLLVINTLLLVFNLLPIFPLDGGQILRSLLWYVVGRARSLIISTVIGFGGAALLVFFLINPPNIPVVKGFFSGNPIWLLILAGFMVLNCWSGFVHARMLARAENAPRHEGFACPTCKAVPPQGPFWMCGQCRKGFDTFDTNATCPFCGTQFGSTRCMECGGMFAMEQWLVRPPSWQERPPVNVLPPPLPPRQW